MSKVADIRVLEAAKATVEPGVPDQVQVALTDIAATARRACWPCRCRWGWR